MYFQKKRRRAKRRSPIVCRKMAAKPLGQKCSFLADFRKWSGVLIIEKIGAINLLPRLINQPIRTVVNSIICRHTIIIAEIAGASSCFFVFYFSLLNCSHLNCTRPILPNVSGLLWSSMCHWRSQACHPHADLFVLLPHQLNSVVPLASRNFSKFGSLTENWRLFSALYDSCYLQNYTEQILSTERSISVWLASNLPHFMATAICTTTKPHPFRLLMIGLFRFGVHSQRAKSPIVRAACSGMTRIIVQMAISIIVGRLKF